MPSLPMCSALSGHEHEIQGGSSRLLSSGSRSTPSRQSRRSPSAANLKEVNMSELEKEPKPAIPPDDPARTLRLVRPEIDTDLPHIGLVGDTYTIVLTGNDTKGRFCLIDMFVPVGGGPPPHRHDFEETFVVMEGEIQATFRGKEQAVRRG